MNLSEALIGSAFELARMPQTRTPRQQKDSRPD